MTQQNQTFDRTNAIIAFFVFLGAFIVYAMTVQRTISYWDCGEFAACANILGIPHPPGTPMFLLIGRLFAMIPFVDDVAYRINYLSVVSSACTALFSYLLTVRLIEYFFSESKTEPINRFIAYVGGIAGAFFVTFGNTNWGNAVEAEVYGLALALTVAIIWLAIRFWEDRGTIQAAKWLILAIYLAMLGISVHMTVFLVMPVVAIFFIMNMRAVAKDVMAICLFGIAALLLIILFSDKPGGAGLFKITVGGLGLGLLFYLREKINWGMAIALIAVGAVILSFDMYIKLTPFILLAILLVGYVARKQFGWRFDWRTALAVVLLAFIGFSIHLFIPIRSTHNPRIDENNPDRSYQTFVNFLDRKQYGQVSMTDRMFQRRGELSNQLGRHAHMGYYSYFEEQWSQPGTSFIPFLVLGLGGMVFLIRRKPEIGWPVLTLFLMTSVGLVLYMNFADGTKYSFATGDAYLEVRDRDYFFTPAFVFFGICMGLGVAAIMTLLRDFLQKSNSGMAPLVVRVSGFLLVLLPGVALAKNYYINDRSENRLAYNYAYNILQSCPPNTILFTGGDNDTFPLWAMQECYDFRKDVRVVNLSLLQTDWYVLQMKNTYNVPISLTEKQIVWEEFQDGDRVISRPAEQFFDRPRNRRAYMQADVWQNRIVRTSEMMMDEIVLENRWRDPIYFSAPPFSSSPLKLTERTIGAGILYRLEREPVTSAVDVETGYKHLMETYKFDGLRDASIFREENATGIQLAFGITATRIHDMLIARGDTVRADILLDSMLARYPEYWQLSFVRSERYDRVGDSAKSLVYLQQAHDTLESFLGKMPTNLFFRQDLGLVKNEIGRRTNNEILKKEGIAILWEAFEANPNQSMAYRKLVTAIGFDSPENMAEVQRATKLFANYKINQNEQMVQQILGIPPPNTMIPSDF